MKTENNSFMVTGAAGFIGSHLAEKLVEKGNHVYGVDCLTDYYPPRLKKNNLNGLLSADNFEFMEKNILDLDLPELLAEVDAVFHQAAQAGVRASWGEEFNTYIDQNIRATQFLLEGIKNSSPETPLIMASSSSVYGVPDSLPMREDMRQKPYSPYGVTKLAAENLGLLYCNNFDLPVVALRYFTVYGPRQRPDMAFSRFLTWIHRGDTIDIYGDGTQSRDFTYVADIVRANLRCLEKESFGEVFNVGGGQRATLNELLDLLEEICGENVNKDYQEFKSGDVPHTAADTSALRDKTGWSPRVSLREGLKKQWDWICDSPEFRGAID